jgi:catalase
MSKNKKESKPEKQQETEKTKQLNTWKESSQDEILSTNTGVKISNTDDSLKAGQRGPTIMEDFHFREKMTHFDHERIPERVVHARGSAAHGYFQVYSPFNEFTKAKLFQDPSKQTPVFVRFSTVVGFRGSPDTVRDVRGFATKFYTEDGIWDLVGNNMPVFFIQDAIKFPDLVHSIKPEPHNEIPQASAAHDNFWDFISLTPESTHMIMWALSDRALPRSYDMMEGFGVHTFRFVNEEGKAHFVKFHWKPVNGMASLVWDETQKIAGKDPDFNRRQLWESIEAGNFPEYELGVQIIPEENEFDFDFDLLDATKLIPEELVPVRRIGKMVLNRNPDNFFAETEQAAFHPGHVVPGIDFTNDPLLQGRLFSYVDTQLTRLGGPNFNEIPINRPIEQVHNNQRDGFMRQTINKGKTNYSPNSVGSGCPFTAGKMKGYTHYMEKVDGHKIRERSDSFKDFFSQAKMFYDSMSAPEKKHILEAFHFELGKVETMEIRERMVYVIANVDIELAKEIAKGIGVEEPIDKEKIIAAAKDALPRKKAKLMAEKSPALSLENHKPKSIKGKKVAILIENGFDHEAVNSVIKMLKESDAMYEIVSKLHGNINSSGEESIKTDKSHVTTASVVYDAIFIPGGEKSVEAMISQGDVIHFINETFKHCKPIALSGEAIKLLNKASVPGLNITHDQSMKNEMGVIMCGEKTFDKLSAAFHDNILAQRFWEREAHTEAVPA